MGRGTQENTDMIIADSAQWRHLPWSHGFDSSTKGSVQLVTEGKVWCASKLTQRHKRLGEGGREEGGDWGGERREKRREETEYQCEW